MVSYRYYTADLLTGNVLGDISPYGVYAEKYLNTQGQFTGTIPLIGNAVRDSLSLQCTEPGKTALYMERDGVLIWGGIIWTRTYSNTSRALEISAMTFDSYFDHVVFNTHFIQQGVAQETIFQNMVTQLQAHTVNLGFTFATPIPNSGIKRTVLIPYYEYHFATDALTQLIGVDQGLEYVIDVLPSTTQDKPLKQIKLGYPQLGAVNNNLVFDYPGQIAAYWLPESAAKSGANFVALGYGDGNKIARAVVTDNTTIAAGYPGWWIVNQYSMIADLTTLKNKASGDAVKYKMPFKVPTFQLKADVGAKFTAWNNLGDTFTAYIDDLRYPNGQTIQSRMIGWTLTPASSDSQEVLALAIDGADV